MVKDYGMQRQPRRAFVIAGAVVAVIAAAAGIVVLHTQQRRAEGMAEYKAWMAAGAPCQALAKGEFDPSQTPQVTSFGGIKVERSHGAAQCHEILNDEGRGQTLFPVCQFDHPGVMEVSTRKGLFWFSPGYVSPATISVENDTPRCVVGATQDFGHTLIFDKPAP